MKCKKQNIRYEVSYIDPADPNGMNEKTWKFKTIKEAKLQQDDLETVWKTSRKEFPIKKVCLNKK